tara:strand:+ start:2030 stop:2698 length:669 start_codon:yes stop_codon:yes gene_type:complete
MIKKIIPVITLDGPAASGKGTISKILSKDLNLMHIETGLFYREIAKQFLKFNNPLNIENNLNQLKIKKFDFIKLNKKNLYEEKISELSSVLAKNKEIRKYIVNEQKNLINKSNIKQNGILLEGRDCGTVIAPEADVKIFITASLEERVKRRFNQIKTKFPDVKYEKIFNDVKERDNRDTNRENSPLKPATDACILDSSAFSIDETINIVKKQIFSKLSYLKK